MSIYTIGAKKQAFNAIEILPITSLLVILMVCIFNKGFSIRNTLLPIGVL